MHVEKKDFLPLKTKPKIRKVKKKLGPKNKNVSLLPTHTRNPGKRDACLNSLHSPWIKRSYSSGMVGLHEEIEDFYNYMRPTEEEHAMRQHVIQSVKDVVLKLWPAAKVDVFGSFRTDLYLPSSDVDIVVFGKWTHLPLWTLQSSLVKGGVADPSSVSVIDKAAVPIIKFTHLKAHVKVDISFNTSSGIQCIKYIKKFLEKFPALPKLVFVLKQFLVMRELNEVWTGGLSSYSVLLLCVSFLQLHCRSDVVNPNVNVATLLIEFFELYGCNFPYKDVCISVKNGGSYINKYKFRKEREANGSSNSLLSIEDPITEGNDLARGSYGMAQVKSAFNYAYRVLHFTMCDLNYRSVSYLSLIVQVSHRFEEKRRQAIQTWRQALSSPTVGHCLTSSSTPDCSSNSSTSYSDFDSSSCPSKAGSSDEDLPASRRELLSIPLQVSKSSPSSTGSASKNLKRHRSPPRTRVTDKNQIPNSKKPRAETHSACKRVIDAEKDRCNGAQSHEEKKDSQKPFKSKKVKTKKVKARTSEKTIKKKSKGSRLATSAQESAITSSFKRGW